MRSGKSSTLWAKAVSVQMDRSERRLPRKATVRGVIDGSVSAKYPPRRRSAVIELKFRQTRIQPALANQLIMRAGRHDTPLIHDQNPIRPAHRG